MIARDGQRETPGRAPGTAAAADAAVDAAARDGSRPAGRAAAGASAGSAVAARRLSAGVAALTMGVVAMAVTPASADPDLWGHLRFGLDLLATGDLYRPDIYSFLTIGVPWINHEWLAEALFAIAWRAGAGHGLVLLKLVVCLAAFVAAYRHLAWRGIGAIAASILLLLAVPLTLPWIAVIRPQMFTYLGFVLTLAAIARAEHGAPRALWALPIVFALWPNLHGGVLAGLGLIGLWLTARAVGWLADPAPIAAWRRDRPLWLPALLAMAATICNPYAGRMWLFFRTALISRLEISEWNPIEVMALEGAAHLLLIAPLAAGWFWSRREKRPALLFLFLVIAALPVLARRNSPLFALGLTLLGGEHLADAAARLLGAWRNRRAAAPADALSTADAGASFDPPSSAQSTPIAAAVAVMPAAVTATATAATADSAAAAAATTPTAATARTAATAGARPAAAVSERFATSVAALFFVSAAACVGVALSDLRITFARADYPVEAVTLLRDSAVQTNLAIPMNWGEYVLWHAGPRVQVSMDGRRETVYTDAGYLEVMDFTFGRDDWDRLLRRPGVDLALVPTADWPAFNLMKLKPGWSPLFVDDRSALFGRDRSAAAAAIARLPRPAKADKLLVFP